MILFSLYVGKVKKAENFDNYLITTRSLQPNDS